MSVASERGEICYKIFRIVILDNVLKVSLARLSVYNDYVFFHF